MINDYQVFKIKYRLDSCIIKYKVCWVVHIYKQQKSVKYNKTWARVVKPSLFWSFFAIIVKQRLYIEQIDILMAFFYNFTKKISDYYSIGQSPLKNLVQLKISSLYVIYLDLRVFTNAKIYKNQCKSQWFCFL